MSLTIDTVPTGHGLSVDDYYRMGEAGIIRDTDRVELIDGRIVQMAPIGPEPSGTVALLDELLRIAFAGQAFFIVQGPIRLGDHSEPQPDVLVLRRRPDFYRRAHPTPEDVLLIIEVARSTLDQDRRIKLPLYARHGIPEVWIVNLPRKLVEAHRDPGPDGYRGITIHGPDASLVPVMLPDMPFELRTILESS